MNNTTLSGLIVVLSIAGYAQGQPLQPQQAEADRGLQEVRVDIGAFSPVGFLGASYNRQLVTHLEVEAGAGIGLSGIQLSAMPKLSVNLLSPANKLYAGAGVALALDPSDHSSIVWLNVDILGYEHRFANHFVVNVGAGWFTGLGGTYKPMNLCITESCGTPQPQSATGINSAQAHVGLGYWF